MRCPGKCADGFDRVGLCQAYQQDRCCPSAGTAVVIELPDSRIEREGIMASLRAWGIRHGAVPSIHLSSGGADSNEKRYTKRDVEAFVAIGIALERIKGKP